MTANRDERTPLRAKDEEFIERLAARFEPAPLSPARRAAFDAALAERIASRRRSRLLAPALAAAAAAVAVAWFIVPADFDPAATGRGAGDDIAAEASAAAHWERELFDPSSLFEDDDVDDLEQLPDDYAAIADAFLDG